MYESLASYGATLYTSLMARWEGKTVEEIAVATILVPIGGFDAGTRRLAITSDVTDRQEDLCARKTKYPTKASGESTQLLAGMGTAEAKAIREADSP
ncbi:hypothetical protein RUM43_002034 [Polyplax serrata]|uniref:Uncharacterized protein n=1 Tax=Polyplax serrata TaxID=468196 RepID=A0AAN8S4E4_POLSC